MSVLPQYDIRGQGGERDNEDVERGPETGQPLEDADEPEVLPDDPDIAIDEKDIPSGVDRVNVNAEDLPGADDGEIPRTRNEDGEREEVGQR
jgi:hypothetical protein